MLRVLYKQSKVNLNLLETSFNQQTDLFEYVVINYNFHAMHKTAYEIMPSAYNKQPKVEKFDF